MSLNPSQATLKTKLTLGLWSYSQLTEAEKSELTAMLRPKSGGFDGNQKSLLAGFYLIAPNEAAIDSLNAGRRHQLAKLRTTDGRIVTLADCLTDMRQGETFWHCASAISTWKFIELPASAFPQVSA